MPWHGVLLRGHLKTAAFPAKKKLKRAQAQDWGFHLKTLENGDPCRVQNVEISVGVLGAAIFQAAQSGGYINLWLIFFSLFTAGLGASLKLLGRVRSCQPGPSSPSSSKFLFNHPEAGWTVTSLSLSVLQNMNKLIIINGLESDCPAEILNVEIKMLHYQVILGLFCSCELRQGQGTGTIGLCTGHRQLHAAGTHWCEAPTGQQCRGRGT